MQRRKRSSNIFWLGPALCIMVVGNLQADDVTLTGQFPNPYGKYMDLTIENDLVLGKESTALASATVYGVVTVNNGINITVEGRLFMPNGPLRTPCVDPATCARYWVTVNKDTLPLAEMDVNGGIYAPEFRAANYGASQLLTLSTCLGSSASTDCTDSSNRSWGRLQARAAGGWADANSNLRVSAQPSIILNANSTGQVLLGTTTPPFGCGPADGVKFAIPTGSDTNAETRAHEYLLTCSRAYKTDILALRNADYESILSVLGNLNVIRFHYLEDQAESPLRLGILAEQSPTEILTDNGKSLEMAQLVGFLFASVKALETENARLSAEVAELEAEETQKASR